MAKYLISYDLNSPGKNYNDLITRIKSYSWAKICKSAWAISSTSSAAQIRDDLINYIDTNDILFVCPCDGWASYGLPKEVVEWLNNH